VKAQSTPPNALRSRPPPPAAAEEASGSAIAACVASLGVCGWKARKSQCWTQAETKTSRRDRDLLRLLRVRPWERCYLSDLVFFLTWTLRDTIAPHTRTPLKLHPMHLKMSLRRSPKPQEPRRRRACRNPIVAPRQRPGSARNKYGEIPHATPVRPNQALNLGGLAP
jgi:hypothetical protein